MQRIIAITALMAVTGCASVPQLESPAASTSEQTIKNASYEFRIRSKIAKVATMSDGFKMEARWASSGYSIEIPSGAKGILTEGGACFANMGVNVGIRGYISNFCFFDPDKIGRFTEAQLDSTNGHGRFKIEPTGYKIASFQIGAGEIVDGGENKKAMRGSTTPGELYEQFSCRELHIEAYQVEGRTNELQLHQILANRGVADSNALKLMFFMPALLLNDRDPVKGEQNWLFAARETLTILLRRCAAPAT